MLRTGHRFVLTTWEPRELGETQLPDRYRNMDVGQALTTAGYTAVEVYERPVWEAAQRATYEAALAAGDPGDDEGLAMLQEEARANTALFGRLRRILAVGQRP
jgi:hypothetical protein